MTSVKDKVEISHAGVSYQITLLNTSRALVTGQELLKLGLPSVGAAADGFMFMDDDFGDNQTWQAVALKENYSSLFTGTSLMQKLSTFMKEYQAQIKMMDETQEAEKEQSE